MTRVLLLTGCAALLFGGCADAPNGAAVTDVDAAVVSVTERIDMASRDGASGVLRITLGDTVLLESGFGSASCTDNEPVTPAHLFMIGSITKEFTQLLAYVLEEKGVFSLDDTVAQLLPRFRGPIGSVTLRQLIDHTGRLPDLIDRSGRPVPYTVEYDYEAVSRDELIERAELAELLPETGEEEKYSNLGYQLLAAIYEISTNETYLDLLRRYVYAPAGMTDTDFWFSDGRQRSFADGCLVNGERWGNPIDDDMWDETGPSWNLMGAGGLLSTAESLARFFAGIETGVYFDDPEQLEKYKSARMSFSERMQQRVMGPAGSNGIFNAVGYWAEDNRFTVIMMTNRADEPAEGGLVQDVLRTFPPDVFPTED